MALAFEVERNAVHPSIEVLQEGLPQLDTPLLPLDVRGAEVGCSGSGLGGGVVEPDDFVAARVGVVEVVLAADYVVGLAGVRG